MKTVDMYLGDSVCLAILREGGGPGAVGGQFGDNRGSCISRHCAGGEKTRRGASAERRRPAGTDRIGSSTAAETCLARVTGRSVMG